MAAKAAKSAGSKASGKFVKKVHDMGGNPAGPVDHHEHTPTLSERRVDAMMMLLRAKPRSYWVTDEMRRTIESLTPDTYNAAGYYEKWARAMRGLLIEKGVVTKAEIDAKLKDVKARYKAAAAPKAKPTAAKKAAPAKKAATKKGKA